MGLPPLSTRQNNQEMGFRSKEWESKMKMEVFNKLRSGLNGHGSKSHGLILWENDARCLGIIKKHDLASRGLKNIAKAKDCDYHACIPGSSGIQSKGNSEEIAFGGRIRFGGICHVSSAT